MQKITQNLVYILTAAIAVMITWHLAPKPDHSPRVAVLPLAHALPAVPANKVHLLSVVPVGKATSLARVNVSMHYDKGDLKAAQRAALLKARDAAAGIGANALVIAGYGPNPVMHSLLIETLALRTTA